MTLDDFPEPMEPVREETWLRIVSLKTGKVVRMVRVS